MAVPGQQWGLNVGGAMFEVPSTFEVAFHLYPRPVAASTVTVREKNDTVTVKQHRICFVKSSTGLLLPEYIATHEA